jgi:proline iminopeptidase
MRVEVDGVRLFFDVDGAKLRPNGPWLDEVPTVVMVHTDPGSDHTGYKEHIGPHLAAVAQVVYVELRGTGRSDRSSPEHGNVETWSSDLRGLVQRLGIQRPVLLASGSGCAVALRFAQRWPDEVSKLVLSSPSARSLPEVSSVPTETLVLAAGSDAPESLDLVREFVA